MTEKKNPYRNWTMRKLERHKSQIDEAITEQKQEIHTRNLFADNYWPPKFFQEIHTEPSCQLAPVTLGDRDVVYNEKTGASLKMKDVALECLRHKVKSVKWSE